MMADLVLRGGRVIDPSQGLDAVKDVAFLDGRSWPSVSGSKGAKYVMFPGVS